MLFRSGTLLEVFQGPNGVFPEPSEVEGRTISQLMPEPVASRSMDAIGAALESDVAVSVDFDESYMESGGSRSFETRMARLGGEEVIAVIRDVTQRKRAEAELAHSAMYDNLTGLANRARLSDQLDQALRRSASLAESSPCSSWIWTISGM